MVALEKRDNDTYYIGYEGGTDEEYASYTAILGTLESAAYDAVEKKWFCNRIDAVRINDRLNNKGVGDGMKLKPYGYQRQAIAFCVQHGFGLLRMPCGSGKTPCGLGAYLECCRKEGRKLVGVFVVKVSLKNQWLDEVKKFTDLRAGEITTYKSATHSIAARVKSRQKKLEKFLAGGMKTSAVKFTEEMNRLQKEVDDLKAEEADAFNSMFDTEKHDIFVVNYEALRTDEVKEKLHAIKPDFFYVDEIDYIKDPKAQRSVAVCGYNDAKYRFGATATPIRKNPLDIYGIFHFIQPRLFPNRRDFEQRYLKFYYGHVSGSKNEEELAEKIQPYIFQRTMDEIADQLPEQIVYQVNCYFNDRQQKVWRQLYGELDDLNERIKALYARFTQAQLLKNEEYQRLQNAVAARQTFAQMQADSEELLMNSSQAAKRYTTNSKSSKVEACIAILQKIVDSGEKCVVFSKFVGMQDILQREIGKEMPGVKVSCITGSTSTDARAAILKDYNTMDDHQVLLLSDAGEAGLNLSTTKYMIEMDLADSAAKQTQRHGRIQRADSVHNKVIVYQLIVKDSYDDTIALKSIEKKQGYSERIL